MRLSFDDDDEEPAQSPLTPLVDVVFLLLIFFLAATTIAREEVELDLRLPPAQSGTASQAPEFAIHVFADGRLSIDGRSVTLASLPQRLAAVAQRQPRPAVLVRGDEAAAFGLCLQVLDACRLAQLDRVGFAALPERKQ